MTKSELLKFIDTRPRFPPHHRETIGRFVYSETELNLLYRHISAKYPPKKNTKQGA